jgi:Fur family iron response transcriptional regulator|tara:strand:+ start:39 stop:473 length:435 start_codon:yes stop_codon:yes gene_type:complete
MEDFNEHIDKLRSSGIRPTKQRLMLSKVLFDQKKTFHFTIKKLKKLVEKDSRKKISLATLYNTVHAFKERGYLKEISLKGNKTFYDTNTKNHHHYYDEELSQLIDIKNENVSINNLPSPPSGKKIKEIEMIIRVASNNQNQNNY